MAFFSKQILGAEIRRNGIMAALLHRGNGKPVLKGLAAEELPAGVLRMSIDAPQVLDTTLFIRTVKELQKRLQTSTKRIALALPDAAARTVVLELEQHWNSQEEAIGMISWKLGKPAAASIREMQLAYQLLGRQEGQLLVLVTMLPKAILLQYEELVRSAGLTPVFTCASQLSLVKAFSDQTAQIGTAVLVTWYADNLGIVMTNDGVPLFWRNKYLPPERGDGLRLDHELHGSLEAIRIRWPMLQISSVCGFAAAADRQMLAALLASLLEPAPLMLEAGALYRDASHADAGCREKGAAAVAAAAAGLLL